jgi:molecular chaperone GrpE
MDGGHSSTMTAFLLPTHTATTLLQQHHKNHPVTAYVNSYRANSPRFLTSPSRVGCVVCGRQHLKQPSWWWLSAFVHRRLFTLSSGNSIVVGFPLVTCEKPQEENASQDDTPEQVPQTASTWKDSSQETASSSEEESSQDILQSPNFLKRKLELVQQELEKAKSDISHWEKQYNEQKESYVRLVADFENYRKRMNKEKQDIAEVTKANVVRELISVLDNFERAAAAIVVQTESERKIHESYQALAKQLLDAMIKLNVEPIDAVGQPFNPNLHEAVNRVDSEDHEEGIVAMQYQRGYKIGERLVRPALCVVSSGPGPSSSSNSKRKEEEEESTSHHNGVKE